MPAKSGGGGGKASFDLLAADSSGDERSLSYSPSPREFPDTPTFNSIVNGASLNGDGNGRHARRKRKPKKKRTESNWLGFERSLLESVVHEDLEFDSSQGSSCISTAVELRQRNVSNGGGCDVPAEEGNGIRESSGSNSSLESSGQWRPVEAAANGGVARLETVESLDWNQVLKQDPDLLGDISSVERSPLKFFVGEIYGGNSLRSTISVGNEKKRQRVYNTMFHVPLRCERLMIAGFFFCLDSFLSLLTIMPARILMTIWRVLKTRQFQRPNAAELSDFGCFVVLAFGVITLQLIDISLIYHIIRGQGTVKLYVVYNVLEIFDKLCQSFGEDVLQVLFNSAEGLANCSTDNLTFELLRFIFDAAIAVVAFNILSNS